MVSFLFWNLNKKPLVDVICRLSKIFEVDVLMFAECQIEPSPLLMALNESSKTQYFYSPCIGCKKINIFVKFSEEFIKPISETARLTIRHLKLPGLTNILLCVTHLPSKLYWKDSSQYFESTSISEMIKQAEKQVGHSRTILVGDFNMNPFEDGVVSAGGFHAAMSRDIAQKSSRIVQDKRYPFFYNPMWGLLGDGSSGPPGTYFYGGSEHTVFFWNMFDQVLIRPELLSSFHNENLCIIDSDGNNSFLNSNGVPDPNIVSDHLPIYFKLSL